MTLADRVALLDRAAAFLDDRVGGSAVGIALRCRFAGNSLRELDLFLNDAIAAARGRGGRRFSAAEAYRRGGAAIAIDPDCHRRLRSARSLQNRLAFMPLEELAGEDAEALADAVRDGAALYRGIGRALLDRVDVAG